MTRSERTSHPYAFQTESRTQLKLAPGGLRSLMPAQRAVVALGAESLQGRALGALSIAGGGIEMLRRSAAQAENQPSQRLFFSSERNRRQWIALTLSTIGAIPMTHQMAYAVAAGIPRTRVCDSA